MTDAELDLAMSALAQLRHAYAQLVAGTVKDQKTFAKGLIAPQIQKLESILTPARPLPSTGAR